LNTCSIFGLILDKYLTKCALILRHDLTSNKLAMNTQISILSLLILLLLSGSPLQSLQAAAVPVITSSNKTTANSQKVKNKKNRIKKQHKKRFKNRLKQFKKTQATPKDDFGTTLIKVLAIAWYPISIGLLITAIVLGLTPLLVVAIVLLALPVFCLIVFGLILLISLMTFSGSLC